VSKIWGVNPSRRKYSAITRASSVLPLRGRILATITAKFLPGIPALESKWLR
jgi:hypothetical protein